MHALRLPENFIEEVIERTDIEEVVSRYVTLKRAGSNLIGLCPFHSEKTPSFSVTPAKKMFYCFGCHAGGSAITFVQKAENLEFYDAVEMLATRAGLSMPRDSGDQMRGEGGVTRKRVLEMNLEAAKYFRACLFDPDLGRPGMEYFKGERGLTEATIKHFGLGYAPEGFGMLAYMRKQGYNDEELQTAFLCGKSQRTGGSYPYFRNRVIFPIIDPAGNVVAFGGRVLDDSKPKYLNTSDTPAFLKSNHLFALNFARHCCAEQMILCEGYMDVIALHAAGFEFAVATLGTAITPNHARIFSKYTKKVIITYDSDEAGQNAANKAMRILSEVGMEVRVLKLNGAKDPDEFIRKFGNARFRQALGESKSGFDYKMDAVLAKYHLENGQDKIRALNELCEIISGYASPVEREVYLAAASDRLSFPKETLQDQVKRFRQKSISDSRKKQSREAQASVKKFGDRVNPEASKDVRATVSEESVLGLLLIFDEYRQAVLKGSVELTADDFVTDFNRRVFCRMMEMQNSEHGFLFELFGEDFTPDEVGRIRKMEVERQKLTQNGPEVFRSSIATLRDVRSRNEAQKGDLTAQIDYLRRKKLGLHKGKADPT